MKMVLESTGYTIIYYGMIGVILVLIIYNLDVFEISLRVYYSQYVTKNKIILKYVTDL